MPEKEIAAYRDKVKCIAGLVERKKTPKPIEEISGEEELCQHCDWTKGKIPHRCDSVCEGAYCEDAYKEYLEEFEEE